MAEKTDASRASEALSENQIRNRFIELAHKTNKEKPRPADVEELRRMLSEHQGLELWRSISGIAQATELIMLSNDASLTDAVRECWRERLKQVRRDLGFDAAPEAEKLLIAHVVLCWLRLNLVERSYTAHTIGNHSMREGLYWERQLSAAQKRYARAVETLAKVRTLTAATRLIESRIEAASAAKRVNNVRTLNALTA